MKQLVPAKALARLTRASEVRPMSLVYSTGDIFKSTTEALVNPVNTVGTMGKGLALQFKRAFPDNFKAYVEAVKRGEVQIGHVFVYEGKFGPAHRCARGYAARYILNVPTKEHWRDPSRIEYVEAGIGALCATIRELNIKSVAVPALGCGLGGLRWDDVKLLIEESLGALRGVDVVVFGSGAAPKHR